MKPQTRTEIKKDFGKIWIYKRDDAGNNYHARIKIDGRDNYIVKSTKKSDLSQAILAAEQIYLKEIQNPTEQSKAPVFPKVVDDLFLKLESQQKPDSLIRDYKSRLNNYACVFWRTTPIDKIDTNSIQNYIDWRLKNPVIGITPTMATIKNDLVKIKAVFTHALTKKHISQPILFPKVSAKYNRRSAFSSDELHFIIQKLDQDIETALTPYIQRARIYLKYYVLALINTGARTGEMLEVKWGCLSGGAENK